MSESEPGEMAPESSRPVVIPKFYIHIYTSILASEELRQAIKEFCISADLRDDDRLAEHVILLRKPPQPLLYMNGTLVNKGEPIPDSQHPRIRTTSPLPVGSMIPDKNAGQKNVEKPVPEIAKAREKKEKWALAKANAKRARMVSSTVPKNKRARKNTKPVRSESKGTNSPALLKQSIPRPLGEATRSKEKEIKTPIIDLTCLFHSIHDEDDDEDANNHRFVPEWCLRDDLRISSYRSCKELILHLVTLAEDTIFRSLTNYKTAFDRVERINNLEDDLKTKSMQLTDAENRVQVLEKEKEGLVIPKELVRANWLSYTAGWLGGLGLGRTKEEIVYPYVEKIFDSYRLPLGDLMKVFSDVPSTIVDDQVGPSAKDGDGEPTKPNSQNVPPAKNFDDGPPNMAS
uniref:Uncharacterized protein n=1 Tax=Tanacetum cinerariifolium TaxID=118510 RepID=A0A6L2JXW6_TANCI|nr:hypothetical protein [Tanacetum cinerariifolium]